MSARVSGLLASLLLWVPPALAQDARLEGRLDARTYAALRPVIDSARSAGLPTEPLVQKALEGAAKGADGARIVAAVRHLSGDLGHARAALGDRSAETEIVAGASAIRAGVGPEIISRLRAARASGPLTVALGVLTDLIARGVPADTAVRAVVALADAGASDEGFASYQRNVERDIGAGVAPASAAVIRVRAVPLSPLPAARPKPAPTGEDLTTRPKP